MISPQAGSACVQARAAEAALLVVEQRRLEPHEVASDAFVRSRQTSGRRRVAVSSHEMRDGSRRAKRQGRNPGGGCQYAQQSVASTIPLACALTPLIMMIGGVSMKVLPRIPVSRRRPELDCRITSYPPLGEDAEIRSRLASAPSAEEVNSSLSTESDVF